MLRSILVVGLCCWVIFVLLSGAYINAQVECMLKWNYALNIIDQNPKILLLSKSEGEGYC